MAECPMGLVVFLVLFASVAAKPSCPVVAEDSTAKEELCSLGWGTEGVLPGDCLWDRETSTCRLRTCEELPGCKGAEHLRNLVGTVCAVQGSWLWKSCVDVTAIDCAAPERQESAKACAGSDPDKLRCAYAKNVGVCFDKLAPVPCDSLDQSEDSLARCTLLPHCRVQNSECVWSSCASLTPFHCVLSSLSDPRPCVWLVDSAKCVPQQDVEVYPRPKGLSCRVPTVGDSDITYNEAREVCSLKKGCVWDRWKCIHELLHHSASPWVKHLPPRDERHLSSVPACEPQQPPVVDKLTGVALPAPPPRGAVWGREKACVHTLPAGVALYHGSPFQLSSDFPAGFHPGSWFSVDRYQACGHMFMQSRGAASRLCDTTPLYDPHVYVYKTKVPLRLLYVFPGPHGHSPMLQVLQQRKGHCPELKLSNATKDNGNFLLGVASSETHSLVEQLCCQGYDGWRAPYDENEVMLCAHALDQVLSFESSHAALPQTLQSRKDALCAPVQRPGDEFIRAYRTVAFGDSAIESRALLAGSVARLARMVKSTRKQFGKHTNSVTNAVYAALPDAEYKYEFLDKSGASIWMATNHFADVNSNVVSGGLHSVDFTVPTRKADAASEQHLISVCDGLLSHPATWAK